MYLVGEDLRAFYDSIYSVTHCKNKHPSLSATEPDHKTHNHRPCLMYLYYLIYEPNSPQHPHPFYSLWPQEVCLPSSPSLLLNWPISLPSGSYLTGAKCSTSSRSVVSVAIVQSFFYNAISYPTVGIPR